MKLGFLKKFPLIGPALFKVRTEFRHRLGEHRLDKALANAPVGWRIVIGASGIADEGWISTDIEYLNLLKARDWERFFQPDSIDALLAEHVWEHLTPEEGACAAALCFKYIKPGGYLRVAVPDGYHPDPDYIERVRIGGSGLGADDHKVLYTHKTFSDLFARAGFRCRLLEYFDAQGTFHSENWDEKAGTIVRSQRFDERNREGKLNYTSIMLDAIKDASAAT